jgi:hypothetical protein
MQFGEEQVFAKQCRRDRRVVRNRIQQEARHPKMSFIRGRAVLVEDDACQRRERKRRLQSMLGA